MSAMARCDPFSPTFDHPLLNSSPEYDCPTNAFRTRPIGSIRTQNSFRERSKCLKNIEDEKNQLIEDLLLQLENTQCQFEKLQQDHSWETQFTRDACLREAALQDQLNRMQSMMDRDPFIIVLIDGDTTIFTEDLLIKGAKGGEKAANLLSEAIRQFVAVHLPHLISPRVVTKIYANFKKLSEKLNHMMTLNARSSFEDFVRGFNSCQLLFDIIDSGLSENATGEKLSESFKLSCSNCHCRQIILSHPPNTSYVQQLLEQCSLDYLLLDHVTLLEPVPVGQSENTLMSQLKSISIGNVFQKTKVVDVCQYGPSKLNTSTSSSLSRTESRSTNGCASSCVTPASTWASLIAQPFVPTGVSARVSRTSTPTSIKSFESAPSKDGEKVVERNRFGQRVDRVDTSVPSHEIQRIKKLKLCNAYYLQGASQCTSNNCSHSHTYALARDEQKILREVARMTPCYYKMTCEDPECIYGHRCPQSKTGESNCWYGEDCRFSGWGHGIDTRVVRTTKV